MRKRNVKTSQFHASHLNVTVVSGISFCSLNFINLANSTEVRVLSICGIKSVDKWTRKDLLQTPPPHKHRHRQSAKEASSMPIPLKSNANRAQKYITQSQVGVLLNTLTFELSSSKKAPARLILMQMHGRWCQFALFEQREIESKNLYKIFLDSLISEFSRRYWILHCLNGILSERFFSPFFNKKRKKTS